MSQKKDMELRRTEEEDENNANTELRKQCIQSREILEEENKLWEKAIESIPSVGAELTFRATANTTNVKQMISLV